MEQHLVHIEIDKQKELANLKVGQSYSYIVGKAKRCLEYRLGSPYLNSRYCNVLKYEVIEGPEMRLLVRVIFGLVRKSYLYR
jgi:hypothetical protein